MKWIRLLVALPVAAYILALATYIILRFTLGDGYWLLGWLNNFAIYLFLPLFVALPFALFTRFRILIATALVSAILTGSWVTTRILPDNLIASPVASSNEPALKVITFNMWGANKRADDVLVWLRDSDADLIAIQETLVSWAGVGLPQLNDVYPYQVSQPYSVRPYGNTLLSRYPIVSNERYELPGLPHDRTLINIEGVFVAVYNIHLVSPQGDQPRVRLPFYQPFLDLLLQYDDSLRNHQIDALLARLETETYPYVVAGDFNTSEDALKYHALAGSLHDSFREAGIGLGGTWPYSGVAGVPRFIPPMLRIDYIWHSDAFVTLNASVGAPIGSDHLPVLATLGFREPVG